MPLNVSSRIEGSLAILELSGKLTLGPSLAVLRETARQVLHSSSLTGIILDVGAVTAADSAGIGELTAVYTLALRQGCRIMLANVSSNLRNILEMTRLDALLPSAVDLAAAKAELSVPK